tara:strand:- start:1399 stop:2847 length:1449 start_codon:yes stop_codon:yes gene_type:complete
MSFATEVAKSISDARVLVEIDVSPGGEKWVNNGAGIWVYNFDATYSWVDSTLLDGFSAQTFSNNVGSVYSSGVQLTSVSSDLGLSPREYYWDAANKDLYICLQNYDEPYIHDVRIGLVYSFSYKEFTPSNMGSPQSYEGRLLSVPAITLARDPLFFGRIQFGGGGISIANMDGEYDTLADDNQIYGNEARVFVGYESLDYDDYERVFTGVIDSVNIGEQEMNVTISDRRKRLTRSVTVTGISAENPVVAIRTILVDHLGAEYTTGYFDTTLWGNAETSLDTRGIKVDVEMQEPEPAIDVIEDLCVAAIGVFFLDEDNKYAFRIRDPNATATGSTLPRNDVLSDVSVMYNPADIVSSFRVGYGKTWNGTAQSYLYTYKNYTEREASVVTSYQIYNQQVVDSLMDSENSVDKWIDVLYDWHAAMHGEIDIAVPIKYYDREIAQTINVMLDRRNATMFGTTLTEIRSISWNLNETPSITFGLRIS